MFSIEAIPYRTHDHGDFAAEWGPRQGISEWWYATGYAQDADGRLFSFQYTLAKRRGAGTEFYVLMLAVTDVASGQHYYAQEISADDSPVLTTAINSQWGDKAGVLKGPDAMTLFARHENWGYDLRLDYGKGATWHCDGGVLQMALPGQNETTTYYSYTNLPTTGTITVEGVTFEVVGKSWFDKQGGPYSETRRETNWEWFSLRFFDDEEMMLFSFPQSDYQDGTYIPKDGPGRRLQDYMITPTKFVTANGLRFSAAWTLTTPGVKDEHYTITPVVDGQFNIAYFELLADITDANGTVVGRCFVELLPGVLNELHRDAAAPGTA